MAGNILRNWFVPKDGISREVISADIQRFLGNDATVRPGKDVVNGKEVEGYWIRAYRNLTTEMINDLKNATQRWDRERGSGSRRVTNYEDSHTYRTSTNGYGPPATGSPQLNGPFQPPPRANLPPADMSSYTDPRPLYPSHSVAAGTSAYVDPSMYVPHARQNPAGYPPQVEFYGSSQPYGHDAPSQHYPGPQYPVAQYGQAPQRDPRDDPRYQPDYQDPQMRYSTYPPVSAPNGVTASSPSQASSSYPAPAHYDQYGRPFSQAPSIPDPPYRPSPSVDPGYHSRDRPSGQPGGDARRRRIG